MRSAVKLASAATVLLASAAGAQDRGMSLVQIPVADTQLVAPSEYGKASVSAMRGAAVIDLVREISGEFAGRVQHLVQVNDKAESPSKSTVTVIRDGLLDDSIRGERWDIVLERTSAVAWEIREVRRAWRCGRAGLPDRFDTVRCP